MPKEIQTGTSRSQQFVLEFGAEDVFSIENKVLIGKVCEVKLPSEKRFSVTQHVTLDKHKRDVQRSRRNEGNKKIQPLVRSMSKKSELNVRLV